MTISLETQQFIRVHQSDDVRTLALQARKYPGVDVPTAVTQIAGRQAAMEKIPSWAAVEEVWYPKHLSLEQCSSEATARYKATLSDDEAKALPGDEAKILPGDKTLVDLTGGFGIDCAFLATRFSSVTYVERQEELCEIAAHNFPVLGLPHIQVKNADGVAYLDEMSPVDCIFLDPARRNEHGGKTVAISDCEPDVAALEERLLEKAKRVMVKLSPMLDLSLALKELRYVQEVHIVSVNNECKELLFVLGRTSEQEPTKTVVRALEQTVAKEVPIHCVNLSTNNLSSVNLSTANLSPQSNHHFVFTREQEPRSECTYTDTPAGYLYEPNASLLKAGAFRSIAATFSIKKLHPNSHLYTSDTLVEDFPGRTFRIISHCGFRQREELADLKKANITVRNFPATVAELRKRMKLADGGDTYLFATTLNDGRKQLIRCEKL